MVFLKVVVQNIREIRCFFCEVQSFYIFSFANAGRYQARALLNNVAMPERTLMHGKPLFVIGVLFRTIMIVLKLTFGAVRRQQKKRNYDCNSFLSLSFDIYPYFVFLKPLLEAGDNFLCLMS